MISATNLDSGEADSFGSSTTTNSITPSAGKLVIVAVGNQVTTSNAGQPTVSGDGFTWTAIGSRQSAFSSGRFRVTLFRGVSNSPSTGALTIDFAGQSQERCCWATAQFAQTNTGGTNASNAIVQYGTNDLIGGGITGPLTITLGAFSSINNGTFGAIYSGDYLTIHVGSGFTELVKSSLTATIETEFANNPQTSVSWTWNYTNTNIVGIGCEIAGAPSEGFFQFL
jgi:hypothetical protein